MEKFKYTTNGYSEAKEWLISIGEWDRISREGLSVDGWSIISAANYLWDKLNGN